MGSLDQRGDISVALVIIYPFIFVLGLILILRHGFSKQFGWLFLMLFATAKIVGAILHVAAEKQSTPKTGLYIAAYTAEGVGLGPLLQCTLSFLVASGSNIIETHTIVTRWRLRLVHLLISGAVVLYVVGAVKSTSDSQDTRSTASSLRKVGGILFVAAFVVLGVIHLLFWKSQHELMKYQRTLLKGISCALPFLGVRVFYSTLSSFSPAASFSSQGIASGSGTGLAKFNSISGSWQIYLVMSVIMEFMVVSIYIFFGLRLPISKGVDYESASSTSSLPLYPQAGTGYYPSTTLGAGRSQYP